MGKSVLWTTFVLLLNPLILSQLAAQSRQAILQLPSLVPCRTQIFRERFSNRLVIS